MHDPVMMKICKCLDYIYKILIQINVYKEDKTGVKNTYIIKSPQSGVTLCFQLVSTEVSMSAAAAPMTFASHVITITVTS